MMNIIPYSDKYQSSWDHFIQNDSWNGTFLHTRKFLAYHGERFNDCSIIISNNIGEPLALFPAAQHPTNPEYVMSHPGITYGGLIAGTDCRGEECVRALSSINEYFAGQGYQRLLYKPVPFIFHTRPYQDDIYALFRLNANRYRCDLTSCIELKNHEGASKRHKRSIKKAITNNIQISSEVNNASQLWNLLNERLLSKYGTSPTHTLAEILVLQKMFPNNIRFVTALDDNEVVAGAVLFIFQEVVHTQYLVANDIGQEKCALHLVIESCIEIAKLQNKKFLNLGISNEKEGTYLNQGLFEFKNNFNAGSCAHEFYEFDLRKI